MTRLLAVGDIHLGRLPANLPDDLAERRQELGPETAWQRAVNEALALDVDGVLLAGDVVERSRDFFVAYGQLKHGIERLAAAGIPVFAVAGNHDTHVLPRLAEEIEHLTLLGAGGQWEQVELGEIDLLGWSFPQTHVRSNPLASLRDESGGQRQRALIGLLHCDRDQIDSHYAPVSSADLAGADTDAWLLGHIHQPEALDQARPIGYLGSVSALRASETGPRGPWLITVEGRRVTAEQRVIAPLRYERLAIDVEGAESAEKLGGRVLSACRQRLNTMGEQHPLPEALGLRLHFHGHSARAAALSGDITRLGEEARSWQESGVHCFIDKIEIELLPALDLASLARRNDPCGLLAQRLLALGQPDEDPGRQLIEQARPLFESISTSREFKHLERRFSDQDIARQLSEAARLGLLELLAQRGDAQ
ncbi:MAG: metallophosphoesterase family protein [Wenzhouxiangella sp.]